MSQIAVRITPDQSQIAVRITPDQSKKINALVRKCCANCVRGNCLLLDDGDEHPCPQLISCSRIMCNYLQDVVLPIDFDLYSEICGGKTKRCKLCGRAFIMKSRNQRYCRDCAERQRLEHAALRQQKYKAKNKKGNAY